ncbi:protein adenylyltransferase SelO [Idiomarina sp. HP20-50]|uniref:protein adenylyltransferase SelO n=1 Tax=Idiomarina sp. HP20-50 TaxID=3070813 RepID=UPI00294B5E43|nr:YdiU family protein [Idiomarina sp. HP20-50]MDV6315239.1 YdiU family protein [Idiomarina sp. HP20-50]
MPIVFDNRFARKFPEITTRQSIKPDGKAQLVWLNKPLWSELSPDEEPPTNLSEWIGGLEPWPGTEPVAQKYAGHQFGHFNPYLGDGRGLLLGQVLVDGKLQDIHIKGAGPTPYSRGADGRAVLRSSIRELLASEAFNALNIPTTRALALIKTEGKIQRERVEPGAMLARTAATHVRFGHFEHCFHRGLQDTMKSLWQDTIEVTWPHLADASISEQFAQVVKSTAEMIASWQAYGFIHGVMNTDNMSLAGETFDFGPYAFLDDYEPERIFNHTDAGGRYGFLQQPGIGLWNLKRLAQAISPLVSADDLEAAQESYEPELRKAYLNLMTKRLGMLSVPADKRMSLIGGWLSLLEVNKADYQLSFRDLIDSVTAQEPKGILAQNGDSWWREYTEAVENKPDIEVMQHVNPWVIVRTHHAHRVITAAEKEDYSLLNDYLNVLLNPFSERARKSQWAKPPTAEEQVSQLSCSS